MRDLFVTLVVFGLLPFVLKRPWWGIILSAWLGYMNPHLLAYGFARTMPYVMIVALTTMLAMFIAKEKYNMIWTRETILLAFFLVWMAITTSMAIYPDLAWEQYVKVIKIQIITFMTILVMNSKSRVNALVWIIALSLGFYGVKGGIFTILHGGVHRVQGPFGSFIGGNNELALALVMTIPLMRYLHLQARIQIIKTGLFAAMLLTSIAAVGSQSRGALVGIVITGAIFWVKSRNKFMSALFIAISAGAIVNLMPQEWYDRMHTIKSYEEDSSAQGRINAWWTAYNLASDRVTGGGFETFRWHVFQKYAPNPTDVHDVHSIYFEVLGEHGYIGLSIFLLLLGFTWIKCRTIIRTGKRNPELQWSRDLASMIQVSIIAYMSAGAFLGLAYFDYLYHLIALTVITAHLANKQPITEAPSHVTAHLKMPQPAL